MLVYCGYLISPSFRTLDHPRLRFVNNGRLQSLHLLEEGREVPERVKFVDLRIPLFAQGRGMLRRKETDADEQLGAELTNRAGARRARTKALRPDRTQ